jgi:hypothetical protein
MKPQPDWGTEEFEASQMRGAGMWLLRAAGIAFVLSWVDVFVIFMFPPDQTWDVIGLIAYFGGPFPILPGALAAAGIAALVISSLMRKKS